MVEAAEEVVERLDLAVEDALDDLSRLTEQIESIDLDTHLYERFDLDSSTANESRQHLVRRFGLI